MHAQGRGGMADIFISFKTDDTPRVQAIHDGFRARGLTVFWSNDIPKGAPNYQAIIKDEILKAPVVVVMWTKDSVHSGPVTQECAQAEKADKLFQVLLDEIEPIDLPMEVKFKAQKTMLLGWTGDRYHPEWRKLNDAIDAKLKRHAPPALSPAERDWELFGIAASEDVEILAAYVKGYEAAEPFWAAKAKQRLATVEALLNERAKAAQAEAVKRERKAKEDRQRVAAEPAKREAEKRRAETAERERKREEKDQPTLAELVKRHEAARLALQQVQEKWRQVQEEGRQLEENLRQLKEKRQD